MANTELVLCSGDRFVVAGTVEEVQDRILAAARGSLLEFAWLAQPDSGEAFGVNPEHVMALLPAPG